MSLRRHNAGAQLSKSMGRYITVMYSLVFSGHITFIRCDVEERHEPAWLYYLYNSFMTRTSYCIFFSKYRTSQFFTILIIKFEQVFFATSYNV